MQRSRIVKPQGVTSLPVLLVSFQSVKKIKVSAVISVADEFGSSG
jgi:2-phospho-L-lactate transferase/gluconeogenesis factor (CofD/UPF0052 family)